MSPFFFKSVLSLFMILGATIAMFTMFEIFGRGTARYKVTTLKVLHRLNGVLYLILFLYIAYHCIDFINQQRENFLHAEHFTVYLLC